MPPPESTEALLAALRTLHPKTIDLNLDRLEALLIKCGKPETKLPPVVHVAGTNGKGSTLAFVRAGLEATGARVHAYTSPHLVSFHERIRVASEIIGDAALAALLRDLLQLNGGETITFFEATTAAALLAFSRTPADYALIEVGMGGRLDATNVSNLSPSVCAITPISLDHQDFLGNTVELIASEKAGILRPNVPAVIARQSAPALKAIRKRAAEVGCPLHVCGEDWHVKEDGDGSLVYQDAHGEVRVPKPAHLLGAHQIENAGVAIAVLRLLLKQTSGSSSSQQLEATAMEGAMLRAQWPARLQRLTNGPLAAAANAANAELWLDGGHNPAAGVALAAALSALPGSDTTTTVFVCGMLRSKDVGGFLAPLRALGTKLYAVPILGEGLTSPALTSEEMAAAATSVGFDAMAMQSNLAAVQQAASIKAAAEAKALRIVITGSLYLAGTVLRDSQMTSRL